MRTYKLTPFLLLFGILSIFLFTRTECDFGDNPEPQTSSKCGKFVPISTIIEHKDLNPADHYDGVNDDEKAVYSYGSEKVNDVCIEEHVKYKVRIYTREGSTAEADYSGEFVYGISYKYTFYNHDFKERFDDIFGYSFYEYWGDAGLKSGVNDPGWFIIILKISFEDKGSAQENHDHLIDFVEFLQFDYDYFEPKDD
jgi:hypothetical protein